MGTDKNKKQFKDTIRVSLKESSYNLEKDEAEITVIELGWSENNMYYDSENLNEIAELLEDRRKMFANHESSLPNWGSRNIFEWACTIKKVFREQDKVKAVIDFTDNPKTKWLKNEAKKHPEEIQFSINAEGFTHVGEIEDREGNIVDKVSAIDSVDLVSYGAAGGKLENIKEALMKLKEKEPIENYEDLLDGSEPSIGSVFDKVKEVETLVSDLIEDSNKKEVDIMDLKELKKEYSDLLEEYKTEISESIEEEVKKSLDKTNELEDKQEKIDSLEEKVTSLEDEKSDLQEEVTKYELREKSSKRKSYVNKLLKESNLNISIDKMPKTFKETVLNLDKKEKEVKGSIDELISFLSETNLVEDAGETSADDDTQDDETVNLTKDDKAALEAVFSK